MPICYSKKKALKLLNNEKLQLSKELQQAREKIGTSNTKLPKL